MKDERGIYYHPTLQDKGSRMYVRRRNGAIEFRMYAESNPEIWERHGWLTLDVVQRAARMYRDLGRGQGDRNPLGLYDAAVAERLLLDEGGADGGN